jgi:small-conductance mechanosensitive channel
MDDTGWSRFKLRGIIAFFCAFCLLIILIEFRVFYLSEMNETFANIISSFVIISLCMWLISIVINYNNKKDWENRGFSLGRREIVEIIKEILEEKGIEYNFIKRNIWIPFYSHSFILYQKPFQIDLMGSKFYTEISIGPLQEKNEQEIKEIEMKINNNASSRQKLSSPAPSR